MADNEKEKIVPDASHSDKKPEWKPTVEATGTLSRAHAKVKKQFDQKQKATDEEQRKIDEALKRAQRPSAAIERQDPRWRKPDPDQFVVQPFAVLRLSHDALRLGLDELDVKGKKLGASPIAITMARTHLADVKRCFDTHRIIEEQGGFFAELDKVGNNGATKFGLAELNTQDEENFATLDSLLKDAASGNHDAVAEAQKLIPDIVGAFELHLRSKEEIMMPLAGKLGGGDIRAAIKSYFEPLSDQKTLSKHTEYISKLLAAKRPFGNVRMFVCALQTVIPKDKFDGLRSGLEKACNTKDSSYWTKIQTFLE